MSRANVNCPNCDRSTLTKAPDEVVKWECPVCGRRVREGEEVNDGG